MKTIILILVTFEATTQTTMEPWELIDPRACGGFSEVIGYEYGLVKCQHRVTKETTWRDLCGSKKK